MDEAGILESVVRNMGAAWRMIRLYPASSPLRLQAAQAVCDSIEAYIEAGPSLRLVVVPEGFVLRGIDGLLTAPGIPEVSDALASHSTAEVRFDATPLAAEVIAFLTAVQLQPHELEGTNGLVGQLAASGVGAIKVVPVAISRVEATLEIPEDEADSFLAELAADSDRFTMWLRSLLTYDDEALIEALLEISVAAKEPGILARSMAVAFVEQDTRGKDRLLEMSVDLAPLRTIAADMLANLSSVELTAAIRGGIHGANPMAMSAALTGLPMGARSQELVDETLEALHAADAESAEIAFLEHMIEIRRTAPTEPSVVDSRPVYRSVLESSRLPAGPLAAVGDELCSRRALDAVGLATVTGLLSTAANMDAYGRVIDALARSIPHLLQTGNADTAVLIVRTLGDAQIRPSRSWPDLDATHAHAVDQACGVASMAALVAGPYDEETCAAHARELVSLGGEKAAWNLADAALTSDADSAMSCAETVLGRRLPELLAPKALSADARHAARLAELFARDGGPRCMQALGLLVGHSDERVRTASAKGICAAGGSGRTTYGPGLLRDASPTVSLVTVSALGRAGGDDVTAMLASRLAEIASDSELSLAREIIAALSRSASDTARAALTRVAEHTPIFQRRKTVEIRNLAKRALASMTDRGAE